MRFMIWRFRAPQNGDIITDVPSVKREDVYSGFQGDKNSCTGTDFS